MLNRRDRDRNKSNGPWGMNTYKFSYRKKGDNLQRSRFVPAPNQESAESQFKYIMNKDNIEVEILLIEEKDK
jgi:hypothetical protein